MFPRSASSSSLTPVSSNTPFPAHIPVFPGPRPFRSFDDLASNLNEPLRALNAYQEAQNSAAHQFDLSIGLKSPSPDLPLEEELRRQEEKDIKEAMRRSAHDTEQARRRATFQDIIDTVTQPSPPPVPTTNLRLRSLSPSPDPPATVLPISHAKKCSTAPIQITKQLSNDWIKPSSTFHVAAPSRRPPTNPELVCRFILVYLRNSAEDPVVLYISAADLPSWPQFRLADSPRTLSDMGIEDIDNTSLEQYSESYHIFMKVSVRHLFTLTTDCVVLLRKQGVRVPDEATNTFSRIMSVCSKFRDRYLVLSHQLRISHRVAMLLAKLVALVVLVQEVKNVDCHPDVEEPRPVVWVRKDLLFRITVGVIDKMLRLICDTNGTWIVLAVDTQAAGVVIKMEGLNIIGGINCIW
ncbi:hypothetical protein B0H14DRAFT_3533036 [Mycena olivaceomarginata]|nr:hypothetical protein B0H14DRAFT_3533036 [Mycena olivaceomarginata]